MSNARRILPLLAAASFAPLVASFSFNIASTPRQCQNLTVSITGSGQAPYRLLIIPFGATPLPNAIEARRITDIPFGGSNTTLSFQLRFPENSQFVAVVSDASGFGTGGTSTPVTVLSGDDGCFDPNTQVAPSWLFHTDPDSAVISCTDSRIWWNDGDPQGSPNFQGVIPGGQSFEIPVGSLTTRTGEGIGFSWTPSVRIGTTLMLLGGDERSLGVAGSNTYTVQQGNSNACLNDNSPSSTPGSPAGGSYPTSTDGSGTGDDSGGGGGSNVGAIVGGVIGGLVGAISIALILLFFIRRKRHNQSVKERPVDLLNEGDGEDDQNHRLPEYYQPEPFVLPDPTVASTRTSGERPSTPSELGMRDRRVSYVTTSSGIDGLLAPPSERTKTSSKSASMPTRRAVNVIVHEDRGPAEEPDEQEPEGDTVELPPAYTDIRQKASGSSAPSGPSGAGPSTVAGSDHTA